MKMNRRTFLKLSGAGLGSLLLPTQTVLAANKAVAAERSGSMLYDAVKCVGCRACQTACKVRAKLPPELDSTQRFEAPVDLSAKTWTLIKLYNKEGVHSFVKNQCMHCIEPACTAACPVGALEKLDNGPVIYHKERCIGCRYCMYVCPFGIPKSQWESALPFIQKCDFCADRQAAGGQPACSEACPTGALIYGTRQVMLDTAHKRLTSNAAYHPHVYGESEAGGTSMLYISQVDFKNLGFPDLPEKPLPSITWPYMTAVPGVIVGMVALSAGIYLRTHRNQNGADKKEG